nr:hypothetical protein HUO10_006494 [Paraburkholderia busanensis]
MNDIFLRAFGFRATGVALLLLSTTVHAAPVDFNGRGVFNFASASGCPFDLTGGKGGTDAGAQASADCNRVALDAQDAHAVVDPAAHTILLSTDAAPASRTLIGDVLLQGSGVAADGRRVPVSVQVLLRRSGDRWSPDIYVHAPVHGKFSDVRMDPYRVVVREGAATRVVFTPEQARDLLAHPSLVSRVARELVEVRAAGANGAHANADTNEITIALGVGQVAKSVARARFSSDQAGDADLNQVLDRGNWSVEVEALSSQIPAWAVKRELFLFGLEASPLLQDVRRRGFDKHDTLAFGVANGKGFVRLNGREEAFDGAVASGRAFMQDSFIGLILAWRRDAEERTASAARVNKRAAGAPA